MKEMNRRRTVERLVVLALAGLVLLSGFSGCFGREKAPGPGPKESLGDGGAGTQVENSTAQSIRKEFEFAWNCYKQYAWGYDELMPLSKTHDNWYGESLGMTIVDSLDSLYLLGLHDEYLVAHNWIVHNLDFDKNISVSVFEVNIRLLGGLITGYQIFGDQRLLELAVDLANRLLPAFESPTEMPYRFVNLRTGEVEDANSNSGEIGTLTLEFGMLSKLTGNPVYYEKAKNAVKALYERRSPTTNLVGTMINVENGQWILPAAHIGGMIDSYYEYLYKAGVLFEDKDMLDMWNVSVDGINTYLADSVYQIASGELWYGYGDMITGQSVGKVFSALACFFPGLLGLSGDTERAKLLIESCWKMWEKWELAPEAFEYTTMQLVPYMESYQLRPEFAESLYYMWKLTGDEKYRDIGKTVFEDIVKYCKCEGGYTIITNVGTKEQGDLMHSFFLAETLKYLYLLYEDNSIITLNNVVFTTEAHPFFIEKIGG